MKRDERIKAFTMRADGRTFPEISHELGYTENSIRSDLLMVIHSGIKSLNVIYPVLREIIMDQYGTIRAFSNACGVPESTSYTVLSGRAAPGKKYKTRVCSTLGISEEEAFSR